MIDLDIIDRIDIARKYYSDSYLDTVEELNAAVRTGDESLVESILNKFPTVDTLLDKLIAKLENKSVYKTFNRIIKDPNQSKYEYIKCFSSLITHASIECEAGNKEYELVIQDLYEKLGKVVLL